MTVANVTLKLGLAAETGTDDIALTGGRVDGLDMELSAGVQKRLAEHVHVLADSVRASIPETDMSGETDGNRVGRGGNLDEGRRIDSSNSTAEKLSVNGAGWEKKGTERMDVH